MSKSVIGPGPFRAVEMLRGIAALGLAFGLWFFVADEQGAEVLVSTPLELVNVPSGLEVVDQSVQEVDVRLRGASGQLRDTPLQGLRARLDLTGEAPGERTWFLGTEAVEAPSGVQVMRVDPSQVVLRLDRTLTSTVRVSPRVLGQPATGFEIHSVEIDPLELAVEGPESLLLDTAQITTEPISAQGLRETYGQRLQIELDPALRPSVRRVDVRLVIGEAREPRDLRLAVWLTPGETTQDALACQPGISEIAATVRIPTSMLGQVNESNLFAVVSCAGLEAGIYEIVPQLLFPEAPDAALGLVSFDPETVTTVVGYPEETTTPAWQPMDEVARPSSPGGGSSGDASQLNRPPTGRTGASRRSALRFGRNTPGPVLPVGAPPSRASSAGPPPGELAPPGELGLTALGAHATSPTGCPDGS